MRREADVFDFAKGELPKQIRAQLSTESGKVPIRLTMKDRHTLMFGVPEAVSSTVHSQVMNDFQASTKPSGEEFRFNLHFPSFSAPRAATGWLRAAYLVFFATLGYRFIFRPELDIVREKIRQPDTCTLDRFRVMHPRRSFEPSVVRVDRPEEFSSYAMLYRHTVVLLPRYNDHLLYERLAVAKESTVTWSGKQYPWPRTGPTFLHDEKPR
jgi:hypothetical protein